MLKFLVRRKSTPIATQARTIHLEGREIPYQLRRSARRTLALRIDDRGVSVAAPRRTAVREIEGFIAGHAKWLFDRLAAQAAQPEPFVPADGALLPVLGEPCVLRLGGSGRRAVWGGEGGELYLPASGDPHAALLRALRDRALDDFRLRVAGLCDRIGIAPPPVRLTSARTRWGSCSMKSGIRLHWRLIHLPPAVIDYVAAHEVAHLVEMNHSPRFWAVVARLHPGWKAARAELRAAARTLPLIGPVACDAWMRLP